MATRLHVLEFSALVAVEIFGATPILGQALTLAGALLTALASEKAEKPKIRLDQRWGRPYMST